MVNPDTSITIFPWPDGRNHLDDLPSTFDSHTHFDHRVSGLHPVYRPQGAQGFQDGGHRGRHDVQQSASLDSERAPWTAIDVPSVTRRGRDQTQTLPPVQRMIEQKNVGYGQQSGHSGEDEDDSSSVAAPPRSIRRDRSPQEPISAEKEGTESSQEVAEEEEDNLNEVAAPPPLQGNHTNGQWRRQSTSAEEEGTESTYEEEEEDNLNEVAAPSPIQEKDTSGQWRRQSYLEDHPRTSSSVASAAPEHNLSKAATQLYIVSYLIFFSFFGTLARLGVQWLTFYPGAPVVISNLWANFGGCVVMGFLSADHKLFQEEGLLRPQSERKNPSNLEKASFTSSRRATYNKAKKTIPLYVGITTGFCGSFTSFSTFVRDMFFALANDVATPINHPGDATTSLSDTTPRNRGYSIVAVLGIIILTLTVSTAAIQLGAHLATFTEPITPTLRFRTLRRIIDPLIVFLAFGCWLGSVLLAILPPDRPSNTWRGLALFALVFSPLGCLLRFYLALKLNGLVAWFPLGTFVANMFGVAVLAMSYDLQHTELAVNGLPGSGVVGCQVLQGIQDGFCGCLTTVSTWALELKSLKRKHAYWYGAASVLGGLAIAVIIMGSVQWTRGFVKGACRTETT